MKLPQSNRVFSYYLPHRELSAYIAYYSIQHKLFSAIAPQFFPDLGGAIIVSQYQYDWEITVWGPFNRLTAVEYKPYKLLAQYFIEFQPGGLSRLVYPNSSEILNRKVTLNEIDYGMHQSIKEIFERHRFIDDEDRLISSLNLYFFSLLSRKDFFANGRPILNFFQDPGTKGRIPELIPYSARHSNRYMNALTGVTGKGYLSLKRLNKAADLLKQTNYSIERIADQLGYYDASHFVHDFMKLSGITPKVYRMNKSVFYNESMKRF